MPVDHVGLFFHRFQRHQENDPEPAAAPRPRLQSPEEVAAKKRAEEASAKAGSLGLLGVFEQANVKDVAAEAIARAVAWCDEQMVGSVDDIKGDHELIDSFLKALDELRPKAKVKIRKALGGHTLGADLLELLEGANAAGDEVVARLVSWCDDGWSSKIGSVDRMKGFANQPSIDALLKALDLPKVPANKLRKALDYNEQQAPPTTSQPERDAREMSRRLQDKSREQQEMRRQQEIPAIDQAYKDTHAEFFAFATAANDAGVAQSADSSTPPTPESIDPLALNVAIDPPALDVAIDPRALYVTLRYHRPVGARALAAPLRRHRQPREVAAGVRVLPIVRMRVY